MIWLEHIHFASKKQTYIISQTLNDFIANFAYLLIQRMMCIDHVWAFCQICNHPEICELIHQRSLRPFSNHFIKNKHISSIFLNSTKTWKKFLSISPTFCFGSLHLISFNEQINIGHVWTDRYSDKCLLLGSFRIYSDVETTLKIFR